MFFKHVKTNFVHFEKYFWIICYPERTIGLKFCGDSILNILGFVKRVFTGQVKQTFLFNKSICILESELDLRHVH